MTLKDLNGINDTMKQIEETKRRIAQLTAKASSTVQPVTGMPRGNGIADKVGDGAAAIADEKRRLRALKRRKRAAYKKLCAYIEGVADPHVQRMLELKYIDGYSWTKVALTIGGGNTSDGVRMACKRYVEKKPKNPIKSDSRAR